MDKFLKKRPPSSAWRQVSAKRARSADDEEANRLASPRLIVAWNCNGLTSRLRAGDGDAIKAFVAKHKPDAIFISEVRVSAANNCSGGKPGPNTKWYRSRMRDSDKKALEDIKLVNSLLSSKEFSDYKSYLSLADTKYAGTAMLLNTANVRKPISVRYNIDGNDVKASVHDPEGRIILAKFENISILHTYAPNNGWEDEHFKRRRAWDDKVLAFMTRMRANERNIMWIGDLNVAPKDVDLSHATFYKKQKGGRHAKGNTCEITPENIGQPGCTPAERKRFFDILEAGGLVDAYRELVGEEHDSGFSWRGVPSGKYGGRGMRIDHCIVAQSLFPSISSVEIIGHGMERTGFLGSDHSPILITCRENVSETAGSGMTNSAATCNAEKEQGMSNEQDTQDAA